MWRNTAVQVATLRLLNPPPAELWERVAARAAADRTVRLMEGGRLVVVRAACSVAPWPEMWRPIPRTVSSRGVLPCTNNAKRTVTPQVPRIV